MGYRKVYIWNPTTQTLDEVGAEYCNTSAPAVHDDTMPATYHHGVQQWFDSRSAFRAATKSIGGYELGNDRMPPKEKKPIYSDKAIERALRQAKEMHSII